MSGSLDKLDKKKAQLKHQLDTARENGDEKEIKTISGFLNKNSRKRDNTIKERKSDQLEMIEGQNKSA